LTNATYITYQNVNMDEKNKFKKNIIKTTLKTLKTAQTRIVLCECPRITYVSFKFNQ